MPFIETAIKHVLPFINISSYEDYDMAVRISSDIVCAHNWARCEFTEGKGCGEIHTKEYRDLQEDLTQNFIYCNNERNMN